MADLGNLARLASPSEPARPNLVTAVVTKAPAGPGEPFYAIVASFDSQRAFEVRNWSGAAPEVDDALLLGIDEDDQPWLVARRG